MSVQTLVSLFVPSLVVGGAERVALNLSQALCERGLQVDLVVQNAIGDFQAKVAPQVRVVNLEAPGIVSKCFALKQYLEREQPTVLLSILDNVNVAGWARMLARVPTRIIVSLHINLSQQPPGFKTRLRPYLVRYSYFLADEVVAVSQGVAENLAQVSGFPRDRIHVIPNPVITTSILQRSQEAVEHPWLTDGQQPVILGVGRLSPEKDFSTLIRAFAIVRQQRPARLIILGDGEERSSLEALVKTLGLEKDVALPGFTENPYAYMSRAAVLVLSSVTEAFGNVVVEAMAVGTSVVSTRCRQGGPLEILDNGRYGKLVSVADVPAFAHAILATLNEPTSSDLLRQRSRNFFVEPVVNRYLEVLGVTP
jgi:glycosyltransferase involved in cell wall biosynthesis